MDIATAVEKRIKECHSEAAAYQLWLTKLRLPNFVLKGLGSLLAFIGGAAILTKIFDSSIPGGLMALVGGMLTGLHTWLGCEEHQLECKKMMGQFESLKSRYESIQHEPDETKQLPQLHELDGELAKVKLHRSARAWKGFLDFGRAQS